MPSNNTKYSEEMRTQTAAYILESGKSATSVAEEMGIDKNTVCKWVRDYRRAHNLGMWRKFTAFQIKRVVFITSINTTLTFLCTISCLPNRKDHSTSSAGLFPCFHWRTGRYQLFCVRRRRI